MKANTQKCTMAQALVRHLTAQKISLGDGQSAPLFHGAFAIFGHGNVCCIGEALEQAGEKLPTYRGQNEQSMGLAAAGYTKAKRRRGIMVCSSSIGPGTSNMVTACAVAHANRLPVLFLVADNFSTRAPDPVLQQIEHFGDQGLTVTDIFRPVARYWDRLTRPSQLIQSLPQAINLMLDPADCGPAVLALPQDVQGEVFSYPDRFFEETTHRIPRPRADSASVREAVAVLKKAKKPLIVAGGGVHYSEAEKELADFALSRRAPVVETMAGRSCLLHDHPANAGPLGCLGSTSANLLAEKADTVLALGTRLQDIISGSWSVFQNDSMRLVSVNAARFDAHKRRGVAVVGDVRETLAEIDSALGDWKGPQAWLKTARSSYASWNKEIAQLAAVSDKTLPSYAQAVGAVASNARKGDLALTAAGGLPGELNKHWVCRAVGDFDCEFGYSCMSYEISGAYGAKIANPDREVLCFCGDGSYLMANSDINSSVRTGHKLIIILCDNGGYAIIDKLQKAMGGKSFNNQFCDCRGQEAPVDFVAHAQSMGADGEWVRSAAQIKDALTRARRSPKTYMIAVRTHPRKWSHGGAWWDVGLPEKSSRPKAAAAKRKHEKERLKYQRYGK